MNDDLDEEIIGSEDGFDEFAQKGGISSALSNPVAKVGVVVAVIAVVIFIGMFFSGDEEQENPSFIGAGSDITSVPGTDDEVALAYVDAVAQTNEAVLDEAIATGESAIPVPIETPTTRLEVPEVEDETEDPLHRWRVLQEERIERQLKTRETDAEPVTVLDAEQQSEAITQLSEAMVGQMEQILNRNNQTKTFTHKTLITYDEDDENGGAASGDDSTDGNDDGNFEEIQEVEVVIPAGKIVYGQMLLEANSDVPFRVLAQMVSGPLTGWKLIGEFEVLEDINLLGVTFSVAVNDKGEQFDVDAFMLNPDTGLAAMRTSINHRYLKRVLLPAAAEFISGFANAVAETGRTSITINGDTVTSAEEEADNDEEVASGLEDAADEISEILDDYADVDELIIIKAGTPIGIFFAENVEKTEEDFVQDIQ